jgi:DNA-binding response OmpR family regulator
MSNPPAARIAIVDDAEVQRRILSALLGKTYEVVTFASGELFFAQANEVDLVLLDIDMAGMNGYEVCRRLRQQEATRELPVIFISGHDTTPERVAAYEAGGDDFIVKPAAANEVLHKVSTILQRRHEVSALTDQSREAQKAAFTAMTNVGELGVLLEFMRHCAGSSRSEQIADHLLAALLAFGLKGAVQVRSNGSTLERSTDQAAPLQTSVMESLRNMGRIFVFGSRGIVNYDHVSVLVTDLPVHNEEHLGRLRDNLALLAEGAEARLDAMQADAKVHHLQEGAAETLLMLRKIVAAGASRTMTARRQNQQVTMELLEVLGGLIESLNVTDIQRETLQQTIEDGMESLARVHEEAVLADDQFASVITSLQSLVVAAGKTAAHHQ